MQESALILYALPMAYDILARIKHSPVLCDGAMGTLLYAKGIFINRCYDELNVSQPDLIRAIHHDYLQAGAEIVETNTSSSLPFYATEPWERCFTPRAYSSTVATTNSMFLSPT